MGRRSEFSREEKIAAVKPETDGGRNRDHPSVQAAGSTAARVLRIPTAERKRPGIAGWDRTECHRVPHVLCTT